MTAQPAGAAMSANAWSTAPFDPEVAARLRDLIERLDAGQCLWLSGYLAGSAGALAPAYPHAAGPGVRLAPAAAAEPAAPAVTILYGSQSGNGQQLAERLGARLAEAGIAHRKLDMLDCRKVDLESAKIALVIVSTHGEGDPPDHAAELHEALHGRGAWKLSHVRFSVLALGDSSYERFCETGRQFDKQLEALGAQRFEARVDCDVDFEAVAAGWMDAVVAKVAAEVVAAPHARAEAAEPLGLARPPSPPASAHTRKNPFGADVLVNQRITARGSTKDVRHIELALEGSHIHYEPGDALGVVVSNRSADVDALLAALGLSADAEVSIGDAELSLRAALLERVDIGPLTPELVRRYAAAAGGTSLASVAENAAALDAYAADRDLLDLVHEHAPASLDAQTFVGILRPLAPRLYSIASSAAMHGGEAHLTVAVTRIEAHGRERIGLASGWLAAADAGGNVPIFLQRNLGFRLPADPDAAVIMIGAGTGVAPYRGFLAEREAAGARGRNWLLFGDRAFELDFLYQAEWLAARKRGTLTRLDVAFSRDQRDKIYVQHRLLEHGAEVWRWLEEGAYLYVCGDASRMAPDVEDALLAIARRNGGHDRDGANDWLSRLKRARRYQRDVY